MCCKTATCVGHRYIVQASAKSKQTEEKRFESLDKKGTGGTSKIVLHSVCVSVEGGGLCVCVVCVCVCVWHTYVCV